LVVYIIYINDARSSKYQIMKYVYLLIKYTKSVLWRVAKRLSYLEEARCLKVNEVLRSITLRWKKFNCYLISIVHAALSTLWSNE